MACHFTILAMDISGRQSSVMCKEANLGTLKCIGENAKKMKTVVMPTLKEQLIADVQGKTLLLVVDESTDVATAKQLCVIVRYYSEVEKILTAFLTRFLLLTLLQTIFLMPKLNSIWRAALATPAMVLR